MFYLFYIPRTQSIIDLSDSDFIYYHLIKFIVRTLYLLWILCDEDTCIQMFSFIPHIKHVVGDDLCCMMMGELLWVCIHLIVVSVSWAIEWNRYCSHMADMQHEVYCVYIGNVQCRERYTCKFKEINIFLHLLYFCYYFTCIFF